MSTSTTHVTSQIPQSYAFNKNIHTNSLATKKNNHSTRKYNSISSSFQGTSLYTTISKTKHNATTKELNIPIYAIKVIHTYINYNLNTYYIF